MDPSPPNLDVFKLIKLVRVRRPLWDRKHSHYHDRNFTMGMWTEVAATLGSDTDSIRTKWKGLRDTFRGELKKVNKSNAQGVLCDSTQWEYFQAMRFIRDHMRSAHEIMERHKIDKKSTDSIRAKWKGLRDTFRGELKKVNKSIAKGVPCTSTQWEYFEEMEFVKDQIYSNKRNLIELLQTPKPAVISKETTNKDVDIGIATFCKAEVKEEEEEDEEDEEEEEPKQKYMKTERSSPTSNGISWHHPRLSPRTCSPQAASVGDSQEPVISPAVPSDDDYSFLMSILPQLRSLPTTRNLYIRLKIQELLYHEIVALQAT